MVSQLIPAVSRGTELHSNDAVVSIDSLTSDNPTALHHYLKGMKFIADGNTASAADEFRIAVSYDSLFALGYFMLAKAVERMPILGTRMEC